MAHHRSRRHRDEAPPAYDPYDAYPSYDTDPYAAYAPRRGSSAAPAPRSPPPSSRRHKSERRRDPSPNYYSDAPRSRPSRHSRRHDRSEPAEPVYRGRSAGPDQYRRRHASPSPGFEKPHRSRTSRSHRDKPHQIEAAGYGAYDRDPAARDPYARDPYSRSRYSPEPRDSHTKSHRRRHSQPSNGQRHPGRTSRNLESDDDHYYPGGSGRGRRPQSRDRGTRHRGGFDDGSPSRGRRDGAGAGERGHTDRSRRQSMPATTKAKKKAAATANAKIPWWQNPMLQAGARTAFTAGAQAAMKSSHDKSPWLGPKGAKVATAAIGAALVDGFMGQKYPNSARQKLAREGVDIATTKATDIPSYKRRH